MSSLTTHVLDTANGIPAKGVMIKLFKFSGGIRTRVRDTVTNEEGRTDVPILSEEYFVPNIYELEFYVGDYFRGVGGTISDPPFLDVVPVRFSVVDHTAHHHVPLLVSPWSYTTNRGS